jgi:hypothetical protein
MGSEQTTVFSMTEQVCIQVATVTKTAAAPPSITDVGQQRWISSCWPEQDEIHGRRLRITVTVTVTDNLFKDELQNLKPPPFPGPLRARTITPPDPVLEHAHKRNDSQNHGPGSGSQDGEH